jgi:hypothetical protein
MIHNLKCESKYFEDVKNGIKPFEIRKNDRNYCVKDYLLIQEYSNEKYTGRTIQVQITYITDFPDGLKEGYVCLGIKKI